jgi:16S rRNA (adenine1518-N6/adenine1519-N6)-dimethyltransferase
MSDPERQTATEIRRRLEAAGVKPRHDLGQNFLIDLNLLEVIVQAAELTTSDVVLEVGTGTGSLTARLAPLARHVVAVEYDPNMARLTAAAVADCTNVALLNCDVLRNKNRIAEEVLSALESVLRRDAAARLKVVANLPYHVATPVISNVVATDLPWSRMVVTIQWELAERMTAVPGTADYSALSVWLQSQCRLEILRRLPPTVFWPRPKVDSAILRIDRDAERQRRMTDRAGFHDFLRDIFTQRRKHLLGVAARLYPPVGRYVLESLHHELHLPLDVRAEGLTVEQLVAYHERLSAAALEERTKNG